MLVDFVLHIDGNGKCVVLLLWNSYQDNKQTMFCLEAFDDLWLWQVP